MHHRKAEEVQRGARLYLQAPPGGGGPSRKERRTPNREIVCHEVCRRERNMPTSSSRLHAVGNLAQRNNTSYAVRAALTTVPHAYGVPQRIV